MDLSIKHATVVLSGLLYAARQNIATLFRIDAQSMLVIDVFIFLLTASVAACLFRHWLREAGDIAGKLVCVMLLTYSGLIAVNVALVTYANLSERHPEWHGSDILGLFVPNTTTLYDYVVAIVKPRD